MAAPAATARVGSCAVGLRAGPLNAPMSLFSQLECICGRWDGCRRRRSRRRRCWLVDDEYPEGKKFAPSSSTTRTTTTTIDHRRAKTQFKRHSYFADSIETSQAGRQPDSPVGLSMIVALVLAVLVINKRRR